MSSIKDVVITTKYEDKTNNHFRLLWSEGDYNPKMGDTVILFGFGPGSYGILKIEAVLEDGMLLYTNVDNYKENKAFYSPTLTIRGTERQFSFIFNADRGTVRLIESTYKPSLAYGRIYEISDTIDQTKANIDRPNSGVNIK